MKLFPGLLSLLVNNGIPFILLSCNQNVDRNNILSVGIHLPVYIDHASIHRETEIERESEKDIHIYIHIQYIYTARPESKLNGDLEFNLWDMKLCDNNKKFFFKLVICKIRKSG